MSKTIFHGGCIRCDMQELVGGTTECTRCCYKEPNWKLPSLSTAERSRPKPENLGEELTKRLAKNIIERKPKRKIEVSHDYWE